MALPVTITKANPAGSDLASTYDDVMRQLKSDLEDLFGIPDATAISNAFMEVIAAGLKNIRFQDAAADPTVAGALQRNAKSLTFHTSERAVDLVPAGVILPFGGSTVPSGWLLCDGQAVSRTTFAALFAAIGTSYGVGDGSTTFNVPNLKGRVPVGRDAAQVEFDVLGETGGAKTHTLVTSEIPSHTHGAKDGTGTGAGGAVFDPDASFTGNVVSEPTGGGGAHNNLQPYQVVNHIIRT